MADLSWPPPSIELVTLIAGGSVAINSFSWLFVPFLSHALGRPDLHPRFMTARSNVALLATLVATYAAYFAAVNITHEAVFGPNTYIGAEAQERLIGMLPQAGQFLQQYGYAVALSAQQQLQQGLALLQQNHSIPAAFDTRQYAATLVAASAATMAFIGLEQAGAILQANTTTGHVAPATRGQAGARKAPQQRSSRCSHCRAAFQGQVQTGYKGFVIKGF